MKGEVLDAWYKRRHSRLADGVKIGIGHGAIRNEDDGFDNLIFGTLRWDGNASYEVVADSGEVIANLTLMFSK